ncbi:hypothetical protein BDC45DRAFT_497224 [Circinella umbellata]|nr:hypothetical protein BDC45DRAFT_497224 [Circinella umbellata]
MRKFGIKRKRNGEGRNTCDKNMTVGGIVVLLVNCVAVRYILFYLCLCVCVCARVLNRHYCNIITRSISSGYNFFIYFCFHIQKNFTISRIV